MLNIGVVAGVIRGSDSSGTACGLPQHGGRMQSTGIKVAIRRCLRHVRVRCISVSAHQLRHCAAHPLDSKP
jgi:hypothetical protein